jgi:dethiobiotin synthetase
VAKNNQNIELDTLKESLRKLQLNADIVLMEAAGGLMTPIEKDFFMIDLAADLADFTVLISHCGLGCINDALLSKKALEDREMPHALLFNRMDGDDFDAISRPFLQSRFEKLLEINDLDNLLTELFK